jgi:hypothetical protein
MHFVADRSKMNWVPTPRPVVQRDISFASMIVIAIALTIVMATLTLFE